MKQFLRQFVGACALVALTVSAVSAQADGAQSGTYRRPRPETMRPAEEFASPYVPLDSWIYTALDRLAALGYAPSGFADLRPWTRMECARLVERAGLDLEAEDRNSQAYEIYAALRTEFATELERRSGSESAEIRVDSLYTRYTGILGTPLADGYHFGQTLVNDYGRPYGRGSNVISGASGWASAGPVAFYVRGEYQHAGRLPAYSESVQQLIGTMDVTAPQQPIHTSALDQANLVEAYAVLNFKGIQMSVGRQSLWWGANHDGPLLYSNNAAGMDMVRLTNPSPWLLPTFFRWLGPIRWDFFLGLPAGHHYPANVAIHGQKISLKPTPNLELGFSRTVVFRPVTLGGFWKSFASVGNKPIDTPGSLQDVGDRRGGFDFSYRIPGLRNWLVVYGDSMTDDDPSPLSAPRRAAMNPGIYLPKLPKVGKIDFRAEFPFTDTPALVDRAGRFFYWNSGFRDSYTNNGKLLGSWVGRDGHGVQMWSTYWFSTAATLELGYRQASVAREFVPFGGSIRDFSARARLPVSTTVDIVAFVQHERWSFPVLSPKPVSDSTVSIEVNYRPKWGKLTRAAD